MDIIELLTRGYRSLGLGADADVLRLFDQRIEGDTVRWVVVDYVSGGRETTTREVVAHDLLGSIRRTGRSPASTPSRGAGKAKPSS